MRKFKNGEKVFVTGNVVVRRSNGKLEKLRGSQVKVIHEQKEHCLCDIGIGKPVFLPKSNLQVA